jgi:steroid 5-alpha reductase family enzyme
MALHLEGWPDVMSATQAVWGLAFLAGTISLLIAGSVGDRQVLLRVIVPFGALYLAYRYTQKQTRHAQDATPPSEPAGPDLDAQRGEERSRDRVAA